MMMAVLVSVFQGPGSVCHIVLIASMATRTLSALFLFLFVSTPLMASSSILLISIPGSVIVFPLLLLVLTSSLFYIGVNHCAYMVTSTGDFRLPLN